MIKLAEFLEKSNDAKSPDDLTRSFSGFLGEFGIESFTMSILAHRSIDEMDRNFDRLANYPAAWVERYKARHYALYDPVYQMAFLAKGPFTWDEAMRIFDAPESRRVMDESRDYGLAKGIGLTIHRGFGEIVGFGFSSSDPGMRSDRAALRALQLVSYHCYLSYDELFRPDEAGIKTTLSERERDVLSWIASGMTKAQTADLLCVSESCVKRHCESAFGKLDANSLPQAVASALKLGLIDPF
jgi:DNA-binding CsgD family transcriptional regulator